MIFICPLDICAYKLNSFFFFFYSITYITKKYNHTQLFFYYYLFFSSFLFSFLFSFTSTFTQSTNYKIKKNSKLHKYYVSQFENYKIIQKQFRKNNSGMHYGSAGTVAALRATRRRHWRRVSWWRPKTSGSGASSSSLSSSAGGEGHRHLQQQEKRTKSSLF